MPSRFTRETEAKALDFAQSLRKDLTSEEVKALFDELEEEHALIEAKLVVMGVVFRSVLDETFRKEERELLGPMGMS